MRTVIKYIGFAAGLWVALFVALTVTGLGNRHSVLSSSATAKTITNITAVYPATYAFCNSAHAEHDMVQTLVNGAYVFTPAVQFKLAPYPAGYSLVKGSETFTFYLNGIAQTGFNPGPLGAGSTTDIVYKYKIWTGHQGSGIWYNAKMAHTEVAWDPGANVASGPTLYLNGVKVCAGQY